MNLLQTLRGRLLIAGALLLLAGSLLPWWSYRLATTGAAQSEVSVFSLGLPSAPWLRTVNAKVQNPDGTVTYTTSRSFYPLSLSVLAAVAGLGLIVVALAQREPPKCRPASAS